MHSSLYKRMVRSSMEVVLANRKALRSLAVAFGLALPLTVAGAAYADADVSSDNDASNSNDQTAEVETLARLALELRPQLADSSVDGTNWTDQDANADAIRRRRQRWRGRHVRQHRQQHGWRRNERRDVGQHWHRQRVRHVGFVRRIEHVRRDRLAGQLGGADGDQRLGATARPSTTMTTAPALPSRRRTVRRTRRASTAACSRVSLPPRTRAATARLLT